MQLIRPVRFEVAEVAENVAGILGSLLFRLIPVVAVSGQHMIAFVGLLMGAVVLNYELQFILGATYFWFISPAYGMAIDNLLSVISAGTFIPLWFFPQFIRTIAAYLPYRYLTYVPNAVYLGKIPMEDVPGLFRAEAAWIVAAILLKRFIWARGMKKIVIQGG